MKVVYAHEPFPNEVTKSLFLAGPTPRNPDTPSWRPEALAFLQATGYDGHVFVPEPRDGQWRKDYEGQVDWEDEGLQRADCIVFWIPRDMATMPALTTNDEWGAWKQSGKAVLGTPPGAAHVRYQQHYAKKLSIPVADTLADTLSLATGKLGEGAARTGGECCVPLMLWNKPEFQGWYRAQRLAGNRLDSARVVWSFKTFLWSLHVDVYIRAEDRHKTNEVVIFRPDISSVVLFRRGVGLADTEVILVREFRSPARTVTGLIHELPGGSSRDSLQATLDVAVHEVEEETGFTMDPKRLHLVQARQLAGTLSAHIGTVFCAELTGEEMAFMGAGVGQVRGVIEDTERTYVEITTVGAILAGNLVDWSTVGMILRAILG